MTHGHRSDFDVAQKFLEQRNQTFLGVIGSRSKAATLKKELKKEKPIGEVKWWKDETTKLDEF